MGQHANDVQMRSRAPKGLNAEQWRKLVRSVAEANDMHEWQLLTWALMKVPSIRQRVQSIQRGDK